MGKLCLHASLFIFDRIIIKVAGNQDRHKSSVKFDFGPNQTTHFGVTCPWVMKISHFRTWISLKPVGQSWSNFMCSISGEGERLHKVLGQIELAHWTQVSDRCPLGYLFIFLSLQFSNTKMFLSHFSQELWGLEGWNVILTWTMGGWIVYTESFRNFSLQNCEA